jgi:hypothetical protein
MPNVSGSFSGRATSQMSISLSDTPNHDLNLMQVQGLQTSTDANWNNVRIVYWGMADLIAGSGTQRGYFVNEHPDGDRDFGTFEGKVALAQGTMEGTWKYTGGTGKFKGITGNGIYKGRLTPPAEVENAWEGAYQLATQSQAA